MAYPVFTSVTRTALQTSGTTYAVTLPSGIVAGDLVMVKLAQDGSTASLGVAASGFEAIGTQAISGASSSQWFYLEAFGGETSATFDCANAGIVGVSFIIKDAHATPIGTTDGADFVRSDWNNVPSAASGSLTTGATQGDGCLLLYSFNMDGSNQFSRCELADMVCLDKLTSNSASQASYIIGYRQQQAQGAAPTVTMHNISATEGGNGWVIAIRNKSGGALAPDLRPDIDELQWHGSWNATHDGTPTWQAPSSFAASINSITCSTTAPTVSVSNSQAQTPWGVSSGLSATESTAACWAGGSFTHASTDMTGKVFGFQFSLAAISSSSNFGTEGVIVGFSDGTYWVTYQVISKNKGWLAADEQAGFVAVGHATEYANSEGTSSSSINWGAITRRLYAVNRATTTGVNLWVKNATLFGKTALTGGGSARPSTFNDYYTLMNSWGAWKWAELQGSAQIKPKSSVQIGDGTNTTYFDGATNSIGFPQAWSSTDNGNWQMDWNVATSQVGLFVKAKDGDTIKLAAGAATAGNLQLLTVDAASSTDVSTTYDFAQAFGGFAPTWKTAVPCANAIITGCGQVAFKGADVVSTQVKNSLAGTTAAVVGFDANGGSMTSCTTSATTSTGYHIELGTSVTDFTLTDHTFTGSALTDKVHVLATTGTVTITISGSTSLASGDVTTAGATVSIDAPQLYQSVVVSGFTAGSRIQIYDTTNSVELFNGTASAGDTVVSGTTATWTDPTAAAGSRAIRVRVAYVSGVTAKQFIETSGLTCGITDGTESVTYPVTPTDDAVYNANGLNGSTIYAGGEITFTDAAQDLINMDMSANTISLGTQYAAWVYYAFTSAGIATDIDYINAIDTANYEFTGIKWKNTSSPTAPLKITGGYAWDSVTLDPMDLIDDTGGTIFLTPPHVVAYATGSGPLTPSQESQLAAAAAAPSASTIAASVESALTDDFAALPTAAETATATRAELLTELTRLTKLAALSGIDATLVVTPTTRTAGSVSQTVTTVGETTTVEAA